MEELFADIDGVEWHDDYLTIYADDKLLYEFNSKDYVAEDFATVSAVIGHTIQRILSENYMSTRDAFDASWKITEEFIPWLSSKKGIMRASDAVRNMEEFIVNPEFHSYLKNDFILILKIMSTQVSREYILENEKSLRSDYEETWIYPFIELRIDAEKNFSRASIKKSTKARIFERFQETLSRQEIIRNIQTLRFLCSCKDMPAPDWSRHIFFYRESELLLPQE